MSQHQADHRFHKLHWYGWEGISPHPPLKLPFYSSHDPIQRDKVHSLTCKKIALYASHHLPCYCAVGKFCKKRPILKIGINPPRLPLSNYHNPVNLSEENILQFFIFWRTALKIERFMLNLGHLYKSPHSHLLTVTLRCNTVQKSKYLVFLPWVISISRL